MIGSLLLAAFLLGSQRPTLPVPEWRGALETLYAGAFENAARRFAELAERDSGEAAPVLFQAGAYMWWAKALELDHFERRRIDSLLDLAIRRARAADDMFWLATAYGYRARQREMHGGAIAAAKDGKRMRDGYRLLLAVDSSRIDCYLGLGLYDYGLARARGISRFFAKLLRLGTGDASRGLRYLRRAADEGDLARTEATWVLASVLLREARRDPAARAVLEDEARRRVQALADRYPENPVFTRFLQDLPSQAADP